MDLTEIEFWALGLLIGFLLGWLTNWFFYKKQRKDAEANTKILKSLQRYNDTTIRLANGNEGKIIKNPNGTYAIAWEREIPESLGSKDLETEQKKEIERV